MVTDWNIVFQAVIEDITELKAITPYFILIGLFAAVIGFLLFGRISKALYLFSFAIYISLIIYRCFLNRVPDDKQVFDLHLGTTIESYWKYHFFIDNILLFIPGGLLLTLLAGRVWKGIATSLLLSLCIEVTQIATRLGSFHLDDLVANLFGALIGAVLAGLLIKLKKEG